jgi:hypothetical protein
VALGYGGQLKLRIFGRSLAAIYGKNLRTGKNTFYVAVSE